MFPDFAVLGDAVQLGGGLPSISKSPFNKRFPAFKITGTEVIKIASRVCFAIARNDNPSKSIGTVLILFLIVALGFTPNESSRIKRDATIRDGSKLSRKKGTATFFIASNMVFIGFFIFCFF